ncbi:hypothetical protein Nans01_14870 [Nocardiopsis ansamitocini]|uniref:Uncharacterized protein n=2 Tax=Nocardiopsis ansamitocini TaxID=1670832 RepID=A0A9W6P4X1_9ACTN|nr:hypothetical protein Nans01_14870 [Nocardiopsis ansamitocini]
MEAHTERDQQRIVAAGKVAGKQLKRGVVTTVVDAWALVEFDDMADRFPVPPESGDPNAAESGRFLPHVQPVSLDQHRPPELPSRVPGAGPKPGKRRRVGE